MDERVFDDSVVIDEDGNLYLVIEDYDFDPTKVKFEYDPKTGNCYLDESTDI